MSSFAYLYATVFFKRCFCCLYTWLYGKNAVLRSGIVGLRTVGTTFLTKIPAEKRESFSVICRVPLFHRNEFDSALSNEDRGFILRLVGSYDCGMVFETVFSEERVDGNHAFFVDCRGKSLPRSVVDGLVEWFVPQKIVRFSVVRHDRNFQIGRNAQLFVFVDLQEPFGPIILVGRLLVRPDSVRDHLFGAAELGGAVAVVESENTLDDQSVFRTVFALCRVIHTFGYFHDEFDGVSTHSQELIFITRVVSLYFPGSLSYRLSDGASSPSVVAETCLTTVA